MIKDNRSDQFIFMFQNQDLILFVITADNREVYRVGFPETLLKRYMLYCIIAQESEKTNKLILKGFFDSPDAGCLSHKFF